MDEAPRAPARLRRAARSEDPCARDRRLGRVAGNERRGHPERPRRLDLRAKGGPGVNATIERSALLHGVELYDEMTATVDDRTLEILDRRRRTAIVKRRGWLVRRFLLLADVVGLAAAFLVADFLTNLGPGPDQVARTTEYF